MEEGSYRTYEEWKLKQILIHSQAIEVLTVPMRNGNLEISGPC